jgi:hypothetical protein
MKINLKALKASKKKNFKERLKFVENYANWVKKTPNKVWSKQQKNLIK